MQKILVKLNEERKQLTNDAVFKVKRLIDENHYDKMELLLFMMLIHESIVGIVAGRKRLLQTCFGIYRFKG